LFDQQELNQHTEEQGSDDAWSTTVRISMRVDFSTSPHNRSTANAMSMSPTDIVQSAPDTM
jgi:hypothetical protein